MSIAMLKVKGPMVSSFIKLIGPIQALIISIGECPGPRGPSSTILKESKEPP
jgi:hypothetical protein